MTHFKLEFNSRLFFIIDGRKAVAFQPKQENIWQLSYEQQLALLKLRGIAGINLNYVELSKLRLNKTRYLSYQRQLRSIESIGYYVIILVQLKIYTLLYG